MPRAFKICCAFAQYRRASLSCVSTSRPLTDPSTGVLAACDAPFQSRACKSNASSFPRLLPSTPDDPVTPAAWSWWEFFGTCHKPFPIPFSNRDSIARGADKPFLVIVAGIQVRPHTTIRDSGDFLQQHKWPDPANVVIRFALD